MPSPCRLQHGTKTLKLAVPADKHPRSLNRERKPEHGIAAAPPRVGISHEGPWSSVVRPAAVHRRGIVLAPRCLCRSGSRRNYSHQRVSRWAISPAPALDARAACSDLRKRQLPRLDSNQ
ncbi:MAG: hypothetical protein QOK30_2613 [Nocardioidaceae bacterium]|nr:hypothetical protein [Nocardioidaceae bacterium]